MSKKSEHISVDEYMSKRTVNQKGRVVKASKAPTSWKAETRTATFVMTAEVEDRDQDIIKTAGVDLTEFMKNPVALLMHRSRDWPIGGWENIQKQPTQMLGDLKFIDEGIHEDADKAAAMVAGGWIRAVSIGFMPKTLKRRVMEDGKEIWGYEIDACELYECSLVTVPANPAALVKSAEIDPVLAREILEEVLDNWAKTPDGLIVPRAEYERAYKMVPAGKAKAITVTVTSGESQKEPGSHEIDVEQPAGPTIKAPDLPESTDPETKSAFAKIWEKVFGGKKQEKEPSEESSPTKSVEKPSISEAEKNEILKRAKEAREKAQANLQEAA